MLACLSHALPVFRSPTAHAHHKRRAAIVWTWEFVAVSTCPTLQLSAFWPAENAPVLINRNLHPQSMGTYFEPRTACNTNIYTPDPKNISRLKRTYKVCTAQTTGCRAAYPSFHKDRMSVEEMTTRWWPLISSTSSRTSRSWVNCGVPRIHKP